MFQVKAPLHTQLEQQDYHLLLSCDLLHMHDQQATIVDSFSAKMLVGSLHEYL